MTERAAASLNLSQPVQAAKLLGRPAPSTWLQDQRCGETLPPLMSRKSHQRPDRHAEGFDLFGAAEIRQIDHETGRHHIGADFF